MIYNSGIIESERKINVMKTNFHGVPNTTATI